MTAWILIALQAFEVGFWAGQAGYRRRQREKIRERLVWGRRPAIALPIIDEKLRKAAGIPTATQARVANYLVTLVRWTIQTRAFEFVVLKSVREHWPNGRRLDVQVRLHL
jgi:hypothetical protein